MVVESGQAVQILFNSRTQFRCSLECGDSSPLFNIHSQFKVGKLNLNESSQSCLIPHLESGDRFPHSKEVYYDSLTPQTSE